MVTFECPWCAEEASVESLEPDELTCDACGVRADLAPDPGRDPLAQAA
jgi:transcription elongation factor Elf1